MLFRGSLCRPIGALLLAALFATQGLAQQGPSPAAGVWSDYPGMQHVRPLPDRPPGPGTTADRIGLLSRRNVEPHSAASPPYRSRFPADADTDQATPIRSPTDVQHPAATHTSSATRPQPESPMRGELLQSAQVIAAVGDQVILAGDLLGQINQFLQPYVAQMTPEQLDEQRWQLLQRLLPSAIDTKLIYLDFLREIPAENVSQVLDNLYRQFDDQQLPRMVAKAKMGTAADLDRLLRSFGTSLDSQRRTFAEQILAQQWKHRAAGNDQEVSHEEMITYYREHLADYEIKSKARWEHLMTRFTSFPSRKAAYDELVHMGNEVLRGAPFSVVAQRKSQGPTAQAGGQYDWTTKGSLVSEVLDEALFSLGVGIMSKILEDQDGFHIVRVIERQDAGTVPFEEVQPSIKEKLQTQRAEKRIRSYIEELRQKTLVWSILDEGAPAPGRSFQTTVERAH